MTIKIKKLEKAMTTVRQNENNKKQMRKRHHHQEDQDARTITSPNTTTQ